MFKTREDGVSSYMGYDQHRLGDDVLEDPLGDTLIDVGQVEGVLEAPGEYFLNVKDAVPDFQQRPVKRKYRMRTRAPASTHFCPTCNKELKYPSKIAEHMRKHTGERPYACNVCGLSFSQAHVLKVHLRTHKGERPYKCSFCDRSYSSAAQQHTHEKTHFRTSETRPYYSDSEQPVEMVQRNFYICPYDDCGLQSLSREVVESHINTTHGAGEQPWEEYPANEDDMVLNEHEVHHQEDYEEHDGEHSGERLHEEEGQLHLSPEEGVEEEVHPEEEGKYDYIDYQQLQMDGNEGLLVDDRGDNVIFDHFSYLEDSVPPPTEEIEVETSAQQHQHDQSQFNDPKPEFIEQKVEDQRSNNTHTERRLRILRVKDEMEDSSILEYIRQPSSLMDEKRYLEHGLVEEDMDYDPGDEQVSVWVDPMPNKSKRHQMHHGNNSLNNPMSNLQEVVVDARVLDMAAPKRYYTGGETKPRKNRPTKPARNLDWIIDAVAKGHDVDMASPHNRRKPKVHICEYCGKMDKYPSKILAHMRTHTGEKPYKCEICDMAFAQRTPMRLHVRRHLNQKPYACTFEECGEEFVSGALLNLHLAKKHFKQRKYVCMKGCGRYFASSRNQRHHEGQCQYSQDAGNRFGDSIYQQLLFDEEQVCQAESTENYAEDGLVVEEEEDDMVVVDNQMIMIDGHEEFFEEQT